MSSLLVEKALRTCSLLVKKPLTTDGLLAFVGSTLVKELLATIGLLALTGCCLEAMALILPQVVDCPLPILVGAFRTGASPKKDGPPGQFWRQQVGLRKVLVGAIPRREVDDQHRPGD